MERMDNYCHVQNSLHVYFTPAYFVSVHIKNMFLLAFLGNASTVCFAADEVEVAEEHALC